MTRFVYVLPAGRLRWEVRVVPDPLLDDIRVLADELDQQHHDAVGKKLADDFPSALVTDLRALTAGRPGKRIQSLFYRLKRDALIAARAIALIIGGEVQPHNRWGRIQDPDSYGGDSPRRRG